FHRARADVARARSPRAAFARRDSSCLMLKRDERAPLHEQALAPHVLVEIGDELGVAVEELGRDPLAGADDLLGRLAAARMRHLGIAVGPEAVLAALDLLPERLWPLVGEREAHDRLDRL